jgi:hypothetical protein
MMLLPVRTIGYVVVGILFGVVVGFLGAEARHRNSAAPTGSAPEGKRIRDADASRLPTGFQGLAFGAIEDDAKAKFRDMSCSRKSTDPVNYCFSSIDVADESVDVTLTFADGKFVEAYGTFRPRAWEQIKTVMVQRFGPASYSDVVAVQTAMNARYDNERLVWSWPTVRVQAARFTDRIDKGEMRIMLRSWADRQKAGQSDALAKAARSF